MPELCLLSFNKNRVSSQLASWSDLVALLHYLNYYRINNIIIIIGGSVIAHSWSYLGYGKGVTLDGSPARLDLGATTKLN